MPPSYAPRSRNSPHLLRNSLIPIRQKNPIARDRPTPKRKSTNFCSTPSPVQSYLANGMSHAFSSPPSPSVCSRGPAPSPPAASRKTNPKPTSPKRSASLLFRQREPRDGAPPENAANTPASRKLRVPLERFQPPLHLRKHFLRQILRPVPVPSPAASRQRIVYAAAPSPRKEARAANLLTHRSRTKPVPRKASPRILGRPPKCPTLAQPPLALPPHRMPGRGSTFLRKFRSGTE